MNDGLRLLFQLGQGAPDALFLATGPDGASCHLALTSRGAVAIASSMPKLLKRLPQAISRLVQVSAYALLFILDSTELGSQSFCCLRRHLSDTFKNCASAGHDFLP